MTNSYNLVLYCSYLSIFWLCYTTFNKMLVDYSKEIFFFCFFYRLTVWRLNQLFFSASSFFFINILYVVIRNWSQLNLKHQYDITWCDKQFFAVWIFGKTVFYHFCNMFKYVFFYFEFIYIGLFSSFHCGINVKL